MAVEPPLPASSQIGPQEAITAGSNAEGTHEGSPTSGLGDRAPVALRTVRLQPDDLALTRRTFQMMAEVFAEDQWTPLGDNYLTGLLEDDRLWVYAAVSDGEPIGGLTAHLLPMTRAETSELLIYDLAVRADLQRRGVGNALVRQLLDHAAAAGVGEVWVPADNHDTHALEFYRRTGGESQAVTIFTYQTPQAN